MLNHRINVTPLCDVMLVLLIIFMVVTPVLREKIPVRVPGAEHARDLSEEDAAITLALRPDGLFWGRVRIDETTVATRLGDVQSADPERRVFLKADAGLDYGRVLRVMDLCRQGGAAEVGLVTVKRAGAAPAAGHLR